ncbi:hypothetical protein RND81_02G200300 [Saponaria officinalis]|uniref:Uncharacterized protein n=1 Tax=Saponaria officinalis TaxID=3572 RepID=A0AAW1MNA4_SAPOF
MSCICPRFSTKLLDGLLIKLYKYKNSTITKLGKNTNKIKRVEHTSMYVTRPLSLYKKSPELLQSPTIEGPYSGYLVVHDEDTTPTCLGLSHGGVSLIELPFPSNKLLNIKDYGPFQHLVFVVPILDQPLSSNRYYVIKAHKKHKGEAYSCSKEENRGMSSIDDNKPRHLFPNNIYHQFEFSQTITCNNNNTFTAKSIASDGHVPRFLRNIPSIQIHKSTPIPNNLILNSAKGLDKVLRSRYPSFDFPITRVSSDAVCVGKWVCPFMFIFDGELGYQVKNSMYYEMSLEQTWERIFTSDNNLANNNNHNNNKVMIDVVVPIQEFKIGGKDGVIDSRKCDGNVVWFRTIGSVGEERSVGLSTMIVERMIWEQKRVGWVNNEKQVRVVREEEYGGIGWWVRFGCFVLVERFVLRRMDGSLVFTCDFKHTQEIRTKWE